MADASTREQALILQAAAQILRRRSTKVTFAILVIIRVLERYADKIDAADRHGEEEPMFVTVAAAGHQVQVKLWPASGAPAARSFSPEQARVLAGLLLKIAGTVDGDHD